MSFRRCWLSVITCASLVLTMGSLAGVAGVAHAVPDDDTVLSSWRPYGGTVYDLARVGDALLLAGSFTAMRSPEGQKVARPGLAAVRVSDGTLLPWDPKPDGTVRTLSVTPDHHHVVVGGEFSSIGGVSRYNFALVDVDDGQVGPLRFNTNGEVMDTEVVGDRAYLVGRFQRAGGVARGRGAAVDLTTGTLTDWNPEANARVYAIALAPDGVYLGGGFTQVGGEYRRYTGKVDPKGAALPWQTTPTCQDTIDKPCEVFDLLFTGDVLYEAVAGPGGRVVALDANTGTERWVTSADGDFVTLALNGDTLYGGGHFTDEVEGNNRAGLVALDAGTGAVLPSWDTRITGNTVVWTVLSSPGRLDLGGEFNMVGTQRVLRLASFVDTPNAPPVTRTPAPVVPTAPGSSAPTVVTPTAAPVPSGEPLAPPTAGSDPATPRASTQTRKPTQIRHLQVTRGGARAVVARWNAPRLGAAPFTYLVRLDPRGPIKAQTKVVTQPKIRLAVPSRRAKVSVRARNAIGVGPAVVRHVRITVSGDGR